MNNNNITQQIGLGNYKHLMEPVRVRVLRILNTRMLINKKSMLCLFTVPYCKKFVPHVRFLEKVSFCTLESKPVIAKPVLEQLIYFVTFHPLVGGF